MMTRSRDLSGFGRVTVRAVAVHACVKVCSAVYCGALISRQVTDGKTTSIGAKNEWLSSADCSLAIVTARRVEWLDTTCLRAGCHAIAHGCSRCNLIYRHFLSPRISSIGSLGNPAVICCSLEEISVTSSANCCNLDMGLLCNQAADSACISSIIGH